MVYFRPRNLRDEHDMLNWPFSLKAFFQSKQNLQQAKHLKFPYFHKIRMRFIKWK